jgi:hypothetical protein
MVYWLTFGNLDYYQAIVDRQRKDKRVQYRLEYCGRCHAITTHPTQHAAKHREEMPGYYLHLPSIAGAWIVPRLHKSIVLVARKITASSARFRTPCSTMT